METKTSLFSHSDAGLALGKPLASAALNSSVLGHTLEEAATKAGLMQHGLDETDAVNVVCDLPNARARRVDSDPNTYRSAPRI